ncbi:hypothetical protein [Hymenobacter armeniacus]|uniref:Capsule assembly Wzi family protein n=1 Tax=Hymenobacter armeniacus TaxID=2771358 RepID=A0ABR8JUA3_9BACT|nr:hypothetical protein [Hymenobacter armeniacus]MBD2722907.1 hypothetical protein [Hymenobacter armeniacus]
METAQAQLDNRAFYQEAPGLTRNTVYAVDPEHDRKWRRTDLGDTIEIKQPEAGSLLLSFKAFTFFKDNEYFNKIVDGYTLYGTQLNPQLVYYPIKDLRLEGGVFLWKDFGNPVLQQVRPTFRATWTVGKQQIILGNIRPHLAHNYIEPMFNFERVMLNPLEEGIQVRYQGTRLFVDQWVDWQRQQYRYSNYQEEVAGGISSSYRISPDGSRWTVAIPFQFTAIHHGGQIDTLNKPLQTAFNEALGLEARYRMDGATVQAVRFNGYVLGFQDYSFTAGQFPYKYGRGLYLNGTLETRFADVMLSYWQGSRFISPLGGDLYQGASRTVSNPDFLDPERKIVMLRLLRDFRIGDAAALTARAEPLFDLNAKLLDYSFAMYLNVRTEWLLGNLSKRVRVGQ